MKFEPNHSIPRLLRYRASLQTTSLAEQSNALQQYWMLLMTWSLVIKNLPWILNIFQRFPRKCLNMNTFRHILVKTLLCFLICGWPDIKLVWRGSIWFNSHPNYRYEEINWQTHPFFVKWEFKIVNTSPLISVLLNFRFYTLFCQRTALWFPCIDVTTSKPVYTVAFKHVFKALLLSEL